MASVTEINTASEKAAEVVIDGASLDEILERRRKAI
jgi:hypothetical protein